ncbi:uncharacterized protein GGS22DRAFT_18112 [Annulohypoxylon maeteangense]|uniref:uncharacterized protein n=1 Tax=Annulohypoxylon maeteangense TaxID=1927788 RepID=UPI0020082ACE|nr:uncharacterized protein GGS22DRAFT_18112 [Annulohypoxylon maeteangense]KAI0890768.1 hypothetical protein GGS22DRAFT_18112 [Annulohypoxylon maeteangense]
MQSFILAAFFIAGLDLTLLYSDIPGLIEAGTLRIVSQVTDDGLQTTYSDEHGWEFISPARFRCVDVARITARPSHLLIGDYRLFGHTDGILQYHYIIVAVMGVSCYGMLFGQYLERVTQSVYSP